MRIGYCSNLSILLLISFVTVFYCDKSTNDQQNPVITDSIVIPCTTWTLLSFPSYKTQIKDHFSMVGYKSKIAKVRGSKFIALDSTDTLCPGIGYWVATGDSTTFRLSDFNEFTEPEMTLHFDTGWHSLGNPYPHEIPIPDTNFIYLFPSDKETTTVYDTLTETIPAWTGFQIKSESFGCSLTFKSLNLNW